MILFDIHLAHHSCLLRTSILVCVVGRVPLDPLLTELLEGGGDVFGGALEFPSQQAVKDIAAKIVVSVTQQK